MLRTGFVAILSLFFLFVGAVKVFGIPHSVFQYQWSQFFEPFGLSRATVRAIGIAELAGALITAVAGGHRPWRFLGPAILLMVTSGAIGFHYRFGHPRDAAPAIVMWVMAFLVLYLQRVRDGHDTCVASPRRTGG